MRLAHKMEQNGKDMKLVISSITKQGKAFKLFYVWIFGEERKIGWSAVWGGGVTISAGKQMVSSPVWWCISGEHQHWGYSPFYRLPRHDHLSGGKMEKLNLSVSLRLTTQRGIFLQNHFLRPTLSPINITAILNEFMYVLSKNLQTSYNFIW